jgi:hypothetical protein
MRREAQLFFGKQEKITGKRITPLLNPILDKTHFWKFMENFLEPVLGKSRK